MSKDLANFRCLSCGATMTGPKDESQCEVCGQTCVEECPLPPIGSKEWKWVWSKKPLGDASSDKATYSVRVNEFTPPTVFDSKDNYVARCRDIHIAKRIAEMLTRRDWRRENRGTRNGKNKKKVEPSKA